MLEQILKLKIDKYTEFDKEHYNTLRNLVGYVNKTTNIQCFVKSVGEKVRVYRIK